ncbi:sensor histidine kinase [Larkinella soli]|uniref:sensor histidine kinase n=1 Tax=Larkinella soli TaxID=1770527 RepID=UPI000FFB2483|nr:histidine kinase [Larkinella soli]
MQLFNHDFIFSDQPRTRLARHGLFWFVVWLYFAGLYGVFPINFLLREGYRLGQAVAIGYCLSGFDAIAFMPAHMTLAYGIIYVLFPRYLPKGQYLKIFGGVLVFAFLGAALSTVISYNIVTPVHGWFGQVGNRTMSSIGLTLMAGLRGTTTVAGFVAAIKLVKIWYLKQRDYQQIEREKLHAELQLLKSQVHPHFLFNTLNNLYALTLKKSEQSPAVVLKLSELLSYMLYDCNAPEVPLEKEIGFMKNYIGLEQLRYGDRLDISINFHGDLQSRQIAPLLLVPFLENAFKHGTSEQLEQAWIFMDLAVEDNTLTFKLVNSREGEPQVGAHPGGIGLQNVQKRLELLYPGRYELQIHPEEETFLVDLKILLPDSPLPGPAKNQSVAEIAM